MSENPVESVETSEQVTSPETSVQVDEADATEEALEPGAPSDSPAPTETAAVTETTTPTAETVIQASDSVEQTPPPSDNAEPSTPVDTRYIDSSVPLVCSHVITHKTAEGDIIEASGYSWENAQAVLNTMLSFGG